MNQALYGCDLLKHNYKKYGVSLNILSIKKRIEDDCNVNLRKDSPEKIALSLMDFVFRTTRRGNEAPLEPRQRYLTASATPPVIQVCSGYGNELMFLLEAVGIPTRKIYLAASSYFKGKDGDTHVILEAHLNNKWVVLDPSFNCSWNCSNGTQKLSLQEMDTCVKSGFKLIPQEGESKIPGYSIDQYYLPIKDLMYGYKYLSPYGDWDEWRYFHFEEPSVSKKARN